MTAKAKSRAKLLQWRFECLIHSMAEAIAGVLPGPWVFHIGEVLAGLAWYLMPKRRLAVIRNLRVAYGSEMKMAEIMKLARASFRRAGGNLLSGAHTATLPPDKLSEVLRIENVELLRESTDKGRGVVLLLSHMGNWELLSRLIHFLPKGAKVGAMYRPLNNPLMDKRICARREADGTRMFSKRDPFHQITGFLRGGGVVGVLADQRMGLKGDLAKFFGRLTRVSPLPSLLVRRSKAEVLALSLQLESPGKWKASFQSVESPPSSSNCAAALEAAMRCSPIDVFWLQERWRVRLAPWFTLQHLLADGRSDEGKGHRALLWLVGVADFTGLDSIWLHADVAYEVALEEGAQLPPCLPKDTRIHHAEAYTRDQCRAALRKIDQAEVLALDFVITVDEPECLVRACNDETIPVYLHHGDHVEFAGAEGRWQMVGDKWQMMAAK